MKRINKHDYLLSFHLHFHCNDIELELMSPVFIRQRSLSAMNNKILHFTSLYKL